MILAYGQDDRVCAFTSLFAMLAAENLVKTGCCLLVDKEEVGSMGANGLSLNKFTGSRGKSGSNDANAEYIGKIRKVFDDAEVAYQFAELGKADVYEAVKGYKAFLAMK